MGCLVDTFIITPKEQWRDAAALTRPEERKKMALHVPERYRMLLSALLAEFESLNTIMDNRDKDRAYGVLYKAREYEKDDVWFSARNGEECLQQIVRRTFYDTLLIVANDYNPYKYDLFIVVQSRETTSQAKYDQDMPIDLSRRKHNGKILMGNFKGRQA